jgi:serine/threonine-protein kinase
MVGKTISHYKILEKIGEGGMGEVYKARDLNLDRYVALKFLPAELSRDEMAKQRFIQEAKAASALDHPHICTIYEIGETTTAPDEPGSGQLFMAMACYEGETLKQRIESGPLPFEEALQITRQIAQGLAQAHQKGIVHRDIKPANIFLTKDGNSKILDFGLAKLTDQPNITRIGMPLGTVAYMSPEQARGEEVDQRTDIWALGVVLYEMLTGQLSFQGDYAQAVIYSILNEEPKPLSEFKTDIPPILERIVNKAMSKLTSSRYQRMSELLADLNAFRNGSLTETLNRNMNKSDGRRQKRFYRYGVTTVLIVLILFILYLFVGPNTAIDSIAVLPFDNASTDPDMEYLSDGITESLINLFSQLPKLRVIARTTVFNYKGKQVNPQKVGEEVNVRAVLTGKVFRQGEILMIQTDLVDAADGKQIWGQRYDRKIDDLLMVQDEIARQISAKLQIRLTGVEQVQSAKIYTENTRAYQHYLRGRYHWNKRTAEEINKGIVHFEHAIAEDPSYALAYSGLSDCYSVLGSIEYGGFQSKETILKAKSTALKALEIDQNLAEAHTSLANIKFSYEWDWAGTEEEFRRAIELNPNYANAHHWFAHYLAAMGKLDESLSEQKRALELDPLSLIINTQLGMVFYYRQQYDKAIEQHRKTLELDPYFVQAHLALGLAYERKVMYEDAVGEFKKVFTLSGGAPISVAMLAYMQAQSGKRDEALKILDELKVLGIQNSVQSFYIALIYLGLGENDLLYEWLERAYNERSDYLVFLKVEPLIRNQSSDPRFIALLKKMELLK